MTPGIAALERTAEIIRDCGWCQDSWETGEGAVCLVTALQRATTSFDGSDEAHVILQRRLMLVGWTSSMTRWNDVEGRTVDDVLALLEDAS